MNDLLWINGEILPFSEARIGVEDRGFQFADGVYEVIRLYGGRPFTLGAHLDRLMRSCAGIDLAPPLQPSALADEIQKLIARSDVGDGMVYLQITRGNAPRNHVYSPALKPTLLFYARPLPPPAHQGEGEGVKLLAVVDERWKRCWIKSIALLPNVLAKNQAVARGADEAAFVDDGIVTECAASNLFAVVKGTVVTHPVGPKVLPGITRAVLLDLAGRLEIAVEERPLREEEAPHAEEMFITSTTREISWVSRWNDTRIGGGRCGPVTLALHRALRERVIEETGKFRSSPV